MMPLQRTKLSLTRSHHLWAATLLVLVQLFGLSARGIVFDRPGGGTGGSSGGGTTDPTKIAIVSGGGTGNAFTNPTFLTLTNPGPAGITISNDTVNAAVNGPSNVTAEFFGAGPAMTPEIIAVGPLGNYYGFYWNTVHDSSLGRPQDTELTIASPDRIAIIPNIANGTASDCAVQLGGVGVPVRWFINWATNVFTGIGSTPSDGFLMKSGYRSNGVTITISPEIVSSTVSNVAGKGWDSHFYIAHESGYWGNEVGDPDVNKAIVGIDLEMNTNGNGLYTGVTLNGRTNGIIAASIALVGSQITTTSNLAAGDFTHDQWLAPSLFRAGGADSADPAFQVNGHVVQAGSADSSLNFQLNDGAGGIAHAYLASGGNWGGTIIAKAGLAITAGLGNAATNGDDLELNGSGKYYGPTNVAPVLVLSNVNLATATLYTNLTGARVLVENGFTIVAGSASANSSSEAWIDVTNHGVGSEPITGGIQNIAPVTNQSWFPFSFKLGPGDTFKVRISTVGAQSSVTFGGQSIWVTDN